MKSQIQDTSTTLYITTQLCNSSYYFEAMKSQAFKRKYQTVTIQHKHFIPAISSQPLNREHQDIHIQSQRLKHKYTTLITKHECLISATNSQI